MFTSLGHEGYRRVMQNAQDVALHLSSGIEEIGPYKLLTKGDELPVFAFTLKDDVTNYTVYDVSARLRQRGWLVPAYAFPENRQDLSVLRIVVRAGMTLDMADLLLQHLREETDDLESLDGPLPHCKTRTGNCVRALTDSCTRRRRAEIGLHRRPDLGAGRFDLARGSSPPARAADRGSACRTGRAGSSRRRRGRARPACRAVVATSDSNEPTRLSRSSRSVPVITARAARISLTGGVIATPPSSSRDTRAGCPLAASPRSSASRRPRSRVNLPPKLSARPAPRLGRRLRQNLPYAASCQDMAEHTTIEVAGHEVRVSNPQKVFFPELGVTKLDLVNYYLEVADAALNHLRNRPTVLKRFVNGAGEEPFFQKRVPDSAPDWIETAVISFPSGRTAREMLPNDAAHLIWGVNLGVIDWNPWPVRAPDLDHPDELRVDLDPTPEATFDDVRQRRPLRR